MMKKLIPVLFVFFGVKSLSQLPDSCKLDFGINLSGIADYGTEIPFVDMMHCARTWGTQNATYIDGGQNPWDTEVINFVAVDASGYPFEVPFYQDGLGLETGQQVYTVWANTVYWPMGTYTFLYEGEGSFDFWGDAEVLDEAPGIIHLSVSPGVNNTIKLAIMSSNPDNHVRNFRLLIPDAENTYQSEPYNERWLELLAPFRTLRFMDWGRTNNWGDQYGWDVLNEPEDSLMKDWNVRANPGLYTYATNKGVPYEVMIDLCNKLDKDAWVCVPYNASENYISSMAALFRDNLEPERKIYVEYSNENWNWGFGQTQWLYQIGCVSEGIDWPEGIVPYIQNCLDIWTDTFDGQTNRLTRVVGVQGAWQDLSNRIVQNLTTGSFDAFAPAAYFGFSESEEANLDALGEAATAADVAAAARASREEQFSWLQSQKTNIADVYGIPMLYYEGGQHLTPNPFGEEPSYANALIEIQRDTSMYNLYNEWFALLRTLTTNEPSKFMNFSFISERSARYGSWGILEGLYQNTDEIPAPKYRAVIDNAHSGCYENIPDNVANESQEELLIYPNPIGEQSFVTIPLKDIKASQIKLTDSTGRNIPFQGTMSGNGFLIRAENLASGWYVVVVQTSNGSSHAGFLKE
jgi:hypothetical protein